MRHYWGVRVDIFPSVRDYQHVRGLCGNFDGDRNNEFRHRRLNPGDPLVTDPLSCSGSKIGFVRSWRYSKFKIINFFSPSAIHAVKFSLHSCQNNDS